MVFNKDAIPREIILKVMNFNNLEKRAGHLHLSLSRSVERTAKMLGISCNTVYKAVRNSSATPKSEMQGVRKKFLPVAQRKMESLDGGVCIYLTNSRHLTL